MCIFAQKIRLDEKILFLDNNNLHGCGLHATACRSANR